LVKDFPDYKNDSMYFHKIKNTLGENKTVSFDLNLFGEDMIFKISKYVNKCLQQKEQVKLLNLYEV